MDIFCYFCRIFQVSSEKEANVDGLLLQTGQSALFCPYETPSLSGSFTQTVMITVLCKNN